MSKLKLTQLASNMTEIKFDSVSILFSYETPVAGWDNDGAFRTSEHYSATTTKHINKYLGGKDVGRNVDQSYIDNLANAQTIARHWER